MKTVAAYVLLALGAAPVQAQAAVMSVASVPTLDEGGLVALVALVGIVGGVIARRRRK